MTQETEVIRRVLQGDIESFRLLLEKYEKRVVRMVRNVTNDREFGEDIAQDVFLTAYVKLASFDPARSSFSTWLFTIARNKSLNALKKKKAISIGKLPERIDGSNPSDRMAEEELFDELDRQLEALGSRQRRAFILAEFEELSYEQIAQMEGVRVGTVKSRIHRAKKKLRSALKERGGDTA